MKRISHKHSSSIALRNVTVVLVAVLLIVIIIWRTVVASMLWRIVAPMISYDPLSGIFAQMHNKVTLMAENDTLRSELASTTAILADRNVLYQENLELKARFDRDASTQTILAGVILRPPATPYDTLTIDVGSEQGIVAGALVSAGGTTLIGRIDQVLGATSRVVLFSAPGETYQALLIQTASHATLPVSVEGQGGGSLSAEVPANTPVEVGDAVIFPGIAGGLSSTVVAVSAANGKSSEELYLRLPVDLEQLQFVEVLKS